MAREHPEIRFERYCDDVIVHCRSQQQAQKLRDAIAARLGAVGLELNQAKTRVVDCKDSHRRGAYAHERFDFLGYTFRPRLAVGRRGEGFVSFAPAVSDDAAKQMRRQQRRWRLHLRSGQTLADLAQTINAVIRGWIGYYGRFRVSALVGSSDTSTIISCGGRCGIQAAAPQLPAGAAVPGRRCTTRTGTVCPLGAGAAVRPMTRAG